MDPDFASIWLETRNEREPNKLICGIYREWNTDGAKSIPKQLESMQVLTKQIEQARSESKNMIIMADVNLNSDKWDDPTFTLKTISEELRDTLKQCGLKANDNGNHISSC